MATGSNSPYLNNDATAADFIEKFATTAFRQKKPDPLYLSKLIEKFQANRASGMNYKASMAESMAIILASPSFLFIQEAEPAQ